MFQRFSFTPNPNALNNSLNGGLRAGAGIADLIRQGQHETRLGSIADLVKGGLSSPEQFNRVGAELIANGDVNAGLRAIQEPFRREQIDLERNRQVQQQEFNNNIASANLDIAKRRLGIAETAAGEPVPPPNGFRYIDPANPRLGVEPIPGLPQSRPRPRTTVAEINADFEDGLIDQPTRDRLVANATASKNGITIGKDGSVQIGGSRQKSPTEGQANANIFATRGEASNKILDELEAQGTEFFQTLTGQIPIAGNFFRTTEFQRYDQAKRDFINAVLRKESGAVIGADEFANADLQYFPQPGDGAEVIAQKRRNRKTAIQSIRQASGPFAATGSAVEVASPNQPAGTRDNPIGVSSMQQAEQLPKGTYVIIDGRIGVVE